MDYALALAFAAVTDSLCLFTGAGFSKAMAPDAPGWLELLNSACDLLKNGADAKQQIAKALELGLPLEDCAQSLELLFKREGANFRKILADQIGKLKADSVASKSCSEFLKQNASIAVITTNYDNLIVEIAGEIPVALNYPGKPLATRGDAIHVFHIHGHINNPVGLVVTTNDYYSFINKNDYFAQKTLTLLTERTVVILGYSLSDPNLKAILNELKNMSMRSLQRGNIYYITRESIPAFVRDHYEASYGITVVEKTEIAACFSAISARMPDARDRFNNAEKGIEKVLKGSAIWKDDYLKLRESLFHVFGVANVRGLNVLDGDFVKMIGGMLEKKTQFTGQTGAWEQYSHLADWLIYLGSVVEIEGTALHGIYLHAVSHSMTSMTSTQRLGYSWYAFDVWKNKWGLLNLNNRILIERHVIENLAHVKDAMIVVSQA